MAKRRKPQAKEETPDDILRKWRVELFESIREFLIELPTDLSIGEFYVVLTMGDKTYCVTSELWQSDEGARVHQTASAIEAVGTVLKGGDPSSVLFATVLIGVRFAELRLGHLVNSARLVSRSNAEKGKRTARLTNDQWKQVAEFIKSRPSGVSLREICRQASTQLKRAEFTSLPGVRAEITGDALEKRWRKRKQSAEKLGVS